MLIIWSVLVLILRLVLVLVSGLVLVLILQLTLVGCFDACIMMTCLAPHVRGCPETYIICCFGAYKEPA